MRMHLGITYQGMAATLVCREDRGVSSGTAPPQRQGAKSAWLQGDEQVLKACVLWCVEA